MSPYSPNQSDAASSSHTTPYFAPASILRLTHSPDVMLRTISTEQLNAVPTASTGHEVKASPSNSLNGHARKASTPASSALGISPAELLQRDHPSAPEDPSPAGTAKSHGGEDAAGDTTEIEIKGEKGDKRAPQRARTGCLTCRRRKVKCDEGRPRCARCKIKLRECVWPGEGPYSLSKRKASTSLPEQLSPEVHLTPAAGPSRISLHPPSFTDTSNSPANPFSFGQNDSNNLDHLPFSFPIDPFASQPPNTLNPNAISHPFDPSSYLDLLPMLPAPQTSRFYVPPDFLPKTTQPDMFRGFRSNEFVDSLMAPRKKAEAMADPVFLRPYFPTIAERLVMRHYLLETVHVIMAFECPRRPWNPWIEIHAPLAFDHPPGTSPAADALRAAILAVGAVHMRFRADPNDQAGAWNVVRVAKAKVLGLVRQRIEAQEATNTALEKGDVELILAALLSCTIASSLAADDSWHELLTSVLALVDRLGGASNLIREGTHEHLSSFRFFLEQLAIRDVFGCMTTQMSPSILNVAFSPWFFEAEGWSNRDDEWESVERMFGFSRGMVDVIARCCTLISKMKKTGQTLPSSKAPTSNTPKKASAAPHTHSTATLKPPTSPSSFSLRLPARAAARVAQLNGSSSSGSREATPIPIVPPALDHHLYAEAEGLMAELGVWDNVSSLTPFHARTSYGNHSYRHAIRIRLLREVFAVDRDDPRVQTSCASIVELGVESLSLFGRITWLTWPIVIAAFNLMPHDPARLTALSLLSEFGQYACFDNGAACRVMTEFYQHEEVVGCMTPAEVTQRLRSKPFLD